MLATPISSEGWNFERVLGTGGFGIVQLWVHVQSETKLAIKVCKHDRTEITEKQEKRWTHEVLIMKRLKHPNIIKAIDMPFKISGVGTSLPILCMEYCKKGDLRKVLKKIENCCGLNEKELIDVITDVASAVEYLHSNSITHRDLKPENIVLQEEGNKILYKLIDLGYGKELGEASISASIVGTLNYVAPELLWKQRYNCSVDYWSLGILFYELVTGTRPFLPKMQHTMTWMQHVKNKGYNDICAFESEGQVIFRQDISDPTNISRCLRNQLVEWFKVALQWDPKKRGKREENGVMLLVIFDMLRSILSKKIVYVFSISSYAIYAYEATDSTSIADLQYLIEKDTDIPVNQQILTDYFGKVLLANGKPLLMQIQDPILFIFQNEKALMENVPAVNIPVGVQKMMEKSRTLLNFDTLIDYYCATISFIKQEVHLFQLYIFALCIKVDLISTRFGAFHKNITIALEDANNLLSKLSATRAKFDLEVLNPKKKEALEINFEKVKKLVNAVNQIKMKFNILEEKSTEMKNTAQSIDCVKNVSELYDKCALIFKTFKCEHSHKSGRPTEMVKLVFEFLKVREAQFETETSEIMKQISMLDTGLSTLEKTFDSAIAMTKVYRNDLESIIECNNQPIVQSVSSMCNSQRSNMCGVNVAFGNQIFPNSDAMEVLSESCSNLSPIAENIQSMKPENDIVYDNLVLCYTLDSLLSELQKKYREVITLEP